MVEAMLKGKVSDVQGACFDWAIEDQSVLETETLGVGDEIDLAEIARRIKK